MLKKLKRNFIKLFCEELNNLNQKILDFDGNKVKIYCNTEIKKLTDTYTGYCNWLASELIKKYSVISAEISPNGTEEITNQLRDEIAIKKQSYCSATNIHISSLIRISYQNNYFIKLISPTVPIVIGVIVAYLFQYFS